MKKFPKMSAKEFLNLMKEIEIIEYNSWSNEYHCQYDAVISHLKECNDKEFIIRGEAPYFTIEPYNKIREEYEKEVELFVDFARQIIILCNKYQSKIWKYDCNGGDESLDIVNRIATECDLLFKTLKLDLPFVLEPGCGSFEEAQRKVEILAMWLHKREYPSNFNEIVIPAFER